MNSSTRAATLLLSLLFAVGASTAPCIQAEAYGQALDNDSGPVAAIRRLSEQELKAFYLQCSQAAMQKTLGPSAIALCSIGYEVLLKGTFGGDFFALLAWSRKQPRETTETAFNSVVPVESQ
jgi:hypothetical protein